MKHTVTTKLSRPLLVYVCVVGEYYILNSYIRVKSEVLQQTVTRLLSNLIMMRPWKEDKQWLNLLLFTFC